MDALALGALPRVCHSCYIRIQKVVGTFKDTSKKGGKQTNPMKQCGKCGETKRWAWSWAWDLKCAQQNKYPACSKCWRVWKKEKDAMAVMEAMAATPKRKQG